MIDNLMNLVFSKLLQPIFSFVSVIFAIAALLFLALATYTLLKYHLHPFRVTRAELVAMPMRLKLVSFIRWIIVDRIDAPQNRGKFREFGLSLFCGRQGAGKTISMINYLAKMRHYYPACIIVTNFECEFADRRMNSWRDFMEIRNGEDGVIFAIDEIHSEYSAASWKDFPESLLSQVSQQRKQRIKIVATAQVFTRVVKPLREQAFSVVMCRTFAKRWTFCREYDAKEFEVYCDNLNINKKIKNIRKWSFVQSNRMRECYDTYAIIEQMQKLEYIVRSERGA